MAPPRWHRSKAGCTTCRARRVKCDEAKPTCQRCTSAGRACGGYGLSFVPSYVDQPPHKVSGEVSKAWSVDPVTTALVRRPLSLLPGVSNPQERGAFNHFQSYMANKLPGAFHSEFWRILAPQACFQEPEVLHASVALAAAQLGYEKLSLKSYNRAIGDLRARSKSNNNYTLRTTLITCMIFTSLEFIRGSHDTGKVHLMNGLKLLSNLPSQVENNPTTGPKGSIRVPKDIQTVDDCVIEAFARMKVQISLLDNDPEFVLHDLKHHSQRGEACAFDSPSAFDKISDARRSLVLLISETMALSSLTDRLPGENARITIRTRRRHKQLGVALQKWSQAFESSSQTLNPTDEIRAALAIDALRAYHTMTDILAAACLHAADEMLYDKQRDKFVSLLYQIWGIWTKAMSSFETPPTLATFTTDMGFIPPLYFTALKCREPELRRLATDLLDKSPHLEGAWDGRTASAIARHIIELEEGGMFHHCDFSNSPDAVLATADSESPTFWEKIPASKRFNKVIVSLDPATRGKAMVEACKYVRSMVGDEVRWRIDMTEFKIDTGFSQIGNSLLHS